jgi:hypothetical protein
MDVSGEDVAVPVGSVASMQSALGYIDFAQLAASSEFK